MMPVNENDRMVRISEACVILGVHPMTLRKWTKQNKISAYRGEDSVRGQRRYRIGDIKTLMGLKIFEEPKEPLPVAIYCRVSSHDQKQHGDLERQKGRMLEFAVHKKYRVEYILDEVGSGLNDNRKKLHMLMDLAEKHKISKIIVEHKDRLTRFNYEILVRFFNSHGVSVEYVEENLGATFEAELVKDLLSLITVFSAKLHGKRSKENRDRLKKMKEK
jgi:excisionase family DNA binding protein